MADRTAAQAALAEPVAVVGMACRFPGADDLAGFWRMLLSGGEAIGSGTGRRKGRRPGGYLAEVERFDAAFFGISAREAAAMDPQQRILLELCWHALEDARIPPSAPPGPTGVFVGSCSDDYALASRASGTVGPYTMTGIGRAFLANRLSHAFGFTGPSMVIDTGQSSSLVALHQAVGALRRGECAMAVVAGVQLNLEAIGDRILAELGAMSPTGRCHTFDSRADGIVRGEGAGVLILKPLDAALAAGDRVYCTVLASAVNNDGGGPGLTAPSRDAQREVLTRAYREAGVAPSEVAYVELHGTGTPVGDPVEAAALGEVLGRGRPPGAPLLVGSVKTNIGHLEGAAGIAGVIKTAASLFHRRLPPSLNYRRPNPAIDLEGLGLRVCDEWQDWPAADRPLVAGVSSFGLGGTNCHVVLGEAPRPQAGPPPQTGDRAVPVPLSAHDETALRRLAAGLADRMTRSRRPALLDLAFSAATTRAPLRCRAAVVAADAAGLASRLRALADGTEPQEPGPITGAETAPITGAVAPGECRIAYLFPGPGAWRTGLGRRLHKEFEVFARAFDEACAAVEPHLGTALQDTLWERDDLDVRAVHAQPALFALQIALYRLLESWGMTPGVLAGRSQGEFVAAHVAGVLSLEDAATLVAHRARLMDGAAGGSMDELRAVADTLTWNRPVGPVIVSAVTGRAAAPQESAHPDHWLRHPGAATRFDLAVRTAHELGARLFIEAGPGAQLSALAAETLGPDAARYAAPLAGGDETAGVAAAAAAAFVCGAPVDWAALYGPGARPVDLPLYPFQRKPYWLDTALPELTAGPAAPVPDWDGDPAALVVECTNRLLGADPGSELDLDRTFTDLGLDSRMAVALRTAIAGRTGRDLPATLLFDHPTPAALIEALRTEASG